MTPEQRRAQTRYLINCKKSKAMEQRLLELVMERNFNQAMGHLEGLKAINYKIRMLKCIWYDLFSRQVDLYNTIHQPAPSIRPASRKQAA